MEFLTALWLPIVVSAVLVWIASFLTHMVLPHHKSEFGRLPDQDKVDAALEGVAPGRYFFPYCTHAQMKEPAVQERLKKGPNGVLVIWPGPVNMGQNLIATFAFYLLAGAFVAYIGWHGMAVSDPYLERFRLCGAAAFCAHGLGWMPFLIWYRHNAFWPNFFDAVIYALVTAGTFAWLWPQAS